MIKKYTEADYVKKACEANESGKQLYVYVHKEEKEINVPDIELVEETKIVVEYDDEGRPIEKEVTETVEKPVYEEQKVIDEEGWEQIIKVQKTHKETVTEEIAELLIADINYYICYESNYTDGTVNPNYEKEKAEAERKRLDMLSLTKREVFLALYHDKGITPEQIRAQITDTEALIEFDYANDYYRGNPLINSIGALLGYTPFDLDYLFLNKEFPQG